MLITGAWRWAKDSFEWVTSDSSSISSSQIISPLLFPAVEHLLSILSAVYHDYCPMRKDPIESYLYADAQQLFYVFPYSNWLGWLGKIQNVMLTFGWNYIDLFVIIVGMGLSELLARLTRQLQHLVQRVSPQSPHSLCICLEPSLVCSPCRRYSGPMCALDIAPLWSSSTMWTRLSPALC